MRITSFSANFDDESFGLLMERVAAKWPAILTPALVVEMTAFCHSLQHNEERPFSFTASYSGVTTSFGIRAFADDTIFPDVEFFSFPEIIATIQEEHKAVCEQLGY